LFALAKALPSVGVSIRPSETAGAMIATIAEPDSGPVGLTLSRVVDVIPDDGLRLVLGALALGRHRCDAAQHSSLFGLRPRTLQLHHQRIGLPHPQRLRSWGRAVWTAWRLERWNFTCKQAALSGGFDRASALADALRPVLGTTPRGLIVDGGVDRVIYRLRLELSHGHCGIVAPADVPKARPSAASTDSDAGRFRPPTYDVDETVTVPC